jgi:hypothetical protein
MSTVVVPFVACKRQCDHWCGSCGEYTDLNGEFYCERCWSAWMESVNREINREINRQTQRPAQEATPGKPPCGECHLRLHEQCDICGAVSLPTDADREDSE